MILASPSLLDRLLFSGNQLISVLFSTLAGYGVLICLLPSLFLVHPSFLSMGAANTAAGAESFSSCATALACCPSVTVTLSRGAVAYKVLTDRAWDVKALLFQVTLLHVISLWLHTSLAFAEKKLHIQFFNVSSII